MNPANMPVPQQPHGKFWSPTNYSSTGIPGTPYGPGSGMASFLDQLNMQTGIATQSPGGGSVVDWANGLVIQQRQRKAMEAQQMASMTGGMAGAGGNPMRMFMQFFQMMMSMMGMGGGGGGQQTA